MHEIPPDMEEEHETVKIEIKREIKKEDETRNTRHLYVILFISSTRVVVKSLIPDAQAIKEHFQ